jgi:hypothetical protein
MAHVGYVLSGKQQNQLHNIEAMLLAVHSSKSLTNPKWMTESGILQFR